MSDPSSDRALALDVAAMRAELVGLSAKVSSLEVKVDLLTGQANRWKGAFVVLLAVGGTIGWLSDRLLGLLRH